MNLFKGLFGAPAPTYDTEDLYDLVIAVLPVFTALADRVLDSLEAVEESDATTIHFYTNFKASMINLANILSIWVPNEREQKFSMDETEVQKNLAMILNELESCFKSWGSHEAASACNRLRLERKEGEEFTKLRALWRILSEDDSPDEEFIESLSSIVRIYTSSKKTRLKRLETLQGATVVFWSLQPSETESDSPCPIKFSDYPLRHVSKLTRTLFEVIRENWCCQCPSSSQAHVGRKTRLNLTYKQRFETTLAKGEPALKKWAHFRVLFPTTNSRDIQWQETDIDVKNQCEVENTQVNYDLCRVIQVKEGIRPRMIVFRKRLCLLRPGAEANRACSPQVRDDEFKPLKDLLQPDPDGQESTLSAIEVKERVILSFILATTLVHFVKGPWLQANLHSENVCFLVPHSVSSPDVTKPYLTTSCSHLEQQDSPRVLNDPHRFPDILSLGILLLEIARGAPINFEESKDRCVVALMHMDKWNNFRQSSQSRTFPDGLSQAISACINPEMLRANGLDKEFVPEFEVKRYIFEKILYPLEHALSTTWEIQLSTLHKEIARVREASEVASFDHQDELRQEKQLAADEWLEHLKGVHKLMFECKKRCSEAKQEVPRVKIAVLDTGLQLPGTFQQIWEKTGRISVEQSESFVPLAGDEETTRAWSIDQDGHGSRSGQIIVKVAPTAVLHVAKVFKSRKDLSDPRIATQVHERIVEAIKRATHVWNVDMIVMSFGFDAPILSIRNAIDESLPPSIQKPLFFAATRNDGAHKGMAWPAKYRSVIGVSSTDGDGAASTFNPSQRNADPILYAFGEGFPVKVHDPVTPRGYKEKYVSGTSYAAPVAAAMAANLLGCVRTALKTSSLEDQHDYEHIPGELQRLSGMLAVLRQHMHKTHDCGTESLLPWDFLKIEMLNDGRILKDVSETLSQG